MRLFLALWPDPALQAAFTDAARKARLPGKKTRTENIHLTLTFLGETGAEAEDCLRQGLGSVRIAPFDIGFDRMGSFPRTGIAWFGASSIPMPLAELVREIASVTAACEVLRAVPPSGVERQAFVPHVTLARGAGRLPVRHLDSTIRWPVDRFVLVESVLDEHGARYRIVQSWPLLGRATSGPQGGPTLPGAENA